MNKQEKSKMHRFINDNEFITMYIGGGAEFETTVVDSKRLRRLISKMDDQPEPQKVKVPAIVAKWFETNKYVLDRAILDYMFEDYASDNSEFGKWFDNKNGKPIETLVRMLDGYEVEEEPKWVVKSNRLYFTGITQLIARDPITYNFTTDENLAHVFDDKESAEKEASFFDGAVEQVEE